MTETGFIGDVSSFAAHPLLTSRLLARINKDDGVRLRPHDVFNNGAKHALAGRLPTALRRIRNAQDD